jgi:hypothetical protein
MSRGTNLLSMGWFPEAGFIASQWVGYNEAMILVCLGSGRPTNALPSSAWESLVQPLQVGNLLSAGLICRLARCSVINIRTAGLIFVIPVILT